MPAAGVQPVQPEFEVDLLRMRTREGITVARAKGRLRGKQAILLTKQQTELRRMCASGEDSIAGLAELFTIGRATVDRFLRREGSSTAGEAN